MRSKRAIINATISLLYEAVVFICAMVLPRLILSSYGSAYNGITNSITQFLSCISLLSSGIGGVTVAALFKPLAEKDNAGMSAILKATENFLRKIAFIFCGFMVFFAIAYPLVINREFDWVFSSSLVIILGFSTAVQYFFGLTYKLLLIADQRQDIIAIFNIFSTLLSTVVSVVLINNGFGIHIVKIGSGLAFALNPVLMNLYAHRHYKIDKSVQPNNTAVAQRWDAFAHQVALFVHSNTDLMVLSILTNLKEVSVYSVHILVTNGMYTVIKSIISGFSSAFGNMMAKGEKELIESNFKIFELIVFSVATVFLITTGVMFVPFVALYTRGVTDVNYNRPLFALLLTVSTYFNCIRMPYQHVVEAAGHFKQTKKGAFIEAFLNISISIISVFKFGLIGVVFGTLVATTFRTIQYATYLSKHIIPRSIWLFIKHIICTFIIALIVFGLRGYIISTEINSYIMWAIQASIIVVITMVLTIVSDLVFFRPETIDLISKIKGSIHSFVR